MYVILCYDVRIKRNSKVRKIVLKYLRPVQKSVFEGYITESKLKKMCNQLKVKINPNEDAVVIYKQNSYPDFEKIGIGQSQKTRTLFFENQGDFIYADTYFFSPPPKKLTIPLSYNYQLQSAIYSMLGAVGDSDFWHDNGFGDLVKFKGFCFGRLNGLYNVDRENKSICFENNIHLELRSPSFDFIDSFQRSIEQHPFIKLFDTRLEITAAALSNVHLESGRVIFDAVTPVAVHQTLEDGHTHYYSPEEDEYFIRICNNTERKYNAITGMQPDQLFLKPIGDFKKAVINYKGTYITGYTGKFEINTSIKMAEFLYNTGLGEKNSQGFGFLRLPPNAKRFEE